MSRLRVLIADDQPLMRAGFKAVLEATGSIEVVAEAGDGAEAIRAAEEHRPDVVLMDIRMPGTGRHRGDAPAAAPARPRPHDVRPRRVHRRGAARRRQRLPDSRTRRVQELVAAVRAVAAGDAVLSPAVTRQLLDRVAGRLPAPAAHARRTGSPR